MSLEEELKTEHVSHLNLSGICQAESGEPVRQVLARMRQEGHNVCLIMTGDQLQGIFTDRDVLTKVVAQPETLDGPIDAVMTPNPYSVSPDQSAAAALTLMDQHHFRNLPVIGKDGRILGGMTHKAIVDYLASRYPIDILNRPPRPEQFPRKPEGG